MLTEVEAARQRASNLVTEVANKFQLDRRSTLHGNSAGQKLQSLLPAAVKRLTSGLCSIYADVEGATDSPLREEFKLAISDRVIAFIRSSAAGVGGVEAAGVGRLAANLEAGVSSTISKTFDLAAFDAAKARGVRPPASVAPASPSPTSSPAQMTDPRGLFAMLPLHPEIRRVSEETFNNGHYREAILNAGIALVELVKQRAKNPRDKHGKELDGTPLMQAVFGSKPPILRVNDLKSPTDQDEQQGMMFLFSGASMGLRNPRAHGLDPDTAEYAVEAISAISLLAKEADAAKT